MAQLRVFIVEDSPLIRENLISALEELVPLSVVGWADNESGALDWLAEPANACDLAILDLFLRSGSGTGILRALRERGGGPECVVLTNYASPDVARRGCSTSRATSTPWSSIARAGLPPARADACAAAGPTGSARSSARSR